MNKYFYIAFLICCTLFNGIGQTETSTKRWKDMQERISYKSSRRPEGPKKDYINPAGMEDNGRTYSDAAGDDPDYQTNSGTQNYSEDAIYRSRDAKLEQSGRGKVGSRIHRVESPDLDDIELPDVDLPDVDLPDVDVDLPDVDLPEVGVSFWRVLLIVIGVAALAFLLYYFLVKNAPANESVTANIITSDEEEWDPNEISKSELDIKLEKALSEENYRQCVRIYYVFILKELIAKGWIKWERKKTNIHYMIEMAARKEGKGFTKSVNVFELVWYGKYNIKKAQYAELEPGLKQYYKSIETKHNG